MTASVAREFLAVCDPIAVAPMFAPETFEEYAAAGLGPWEGYFTGRAAPLGYVPADVVVATFYNWNPDKVRRELRFDLATPEQALAARERGAQRCMARLLGSPPEPAGVARAVELLREAAEGAPREGRPLFAGHAALAWPDDPGCALWHGATLLREFRGDCHIAVLVGHGVGPIEALLLNAPWIEADREKYLATREWTLQEAGPAIERLTERGFFDADGRLTDGGAKFREMVEVDTDRAAGAPFDAVGPDRCAEALALLRPVAERIVAAKGVPRVVARTARGHPIGAGGSASGQSSTNG